jgi:lysophospholipid acyltransferase (LPLAT)-like uncharacterized protein
VTGVRERRLGFAERLTPGAAARAVRVLGATLRVRVGGAETVRSLWTASSPVIYVVWHGRILMCPWANERLRRSHGVRTATVLASQSRDGGLIARFVERFAIGVIRGSSSRGGAMALRGLASTVRRGEDVVIVPDGPRGPRGHCAPGVVALAAITGAPVVPLGLGARPSLTLSTWDAFQIPLPFATLAVVFGTPVPVAPDADRERMRAELTAALDAVTIAADRLAAGENEAVATRPDPATRGRSA